MGLHGHGRAHITELETDDLVLAELGPASQHGGALYSREVEARLPSFASVMQLYVWRSLACPFVI